MKFLLFSAALLLSAKAFPLADNEEYNDDLESDQGKSLLLLLLLLLFFFLRFLVLLVLRTRNS